MHCEESVKQCLVTQARIIECHLHDLGMAGPVCAYFFVGRVFKRPARVSNGGVEYADHLAESSFHTPETPSPKGTFFNCHVCKLLCLPLDALNVKRFASQDEKPEYFQRA